MLRGDIVKKKRFWPLRCFYGAGFVTAAEVMDVFARLPGMMQYQLIPKSNGGRSTIAHSSKVRLSKHLDTSTTTSMAKILVKH